MNRTILSAFLLSLVALFASHVYAATPRIPPNVHQQLVEARQHFDAEAWDEAKNLLTRLQDTTEHEFSLALIAQTLGQIAINQDRYDIALEQFTIAHDSGVLEPGAQLNLLRAIGQLHCSLDQWIECRQRLENWIGQAPEQASARDFIMIAQAYSATETWRGVIEPADRAIAMREPAPLDWHRLRVHALISLEQWKLALRNQAVLLQQYGNNRGEWRRLVSLQLRDNAYDAARGSLRLMFEKGWFDRESDYRQLVRLYQLGELPYQAATILQQGIQSNLLPRDPANLRQLAGLWSAARESDRAIESYNELVAIDASPEWLSELASLHYEARDWASAAEVLRAAIAKKPDAGLQLMLGISLANLDLGEEARVVFEPLLDDDTVAESARGWLAYLDLLR